MSKFDTAYNTFLEENDLQTEESLKKWFDRNQGKGWIDCKTGKPCGRQKGEK